jgi:orotidine-5'-phosphate decarboxylase
MYEKVIIALDTPDEQKALDMVELLKGKISVFKVGLELFCAVGPDIVKKINEMGCKVFLDLKFHDIPATVAGAAKDAVKTGAFLFNLHAMGGRQMMEKAREAVDKMTGELQFRDNMKPKILAVTVLTSLDDRDLEDLNIHSSAFDQAVALAKMAKACGLDGVVASPKEITAIREAVGKDFLIVTPGVRPVWASKGDQKRVMTPRQALDAGADYIVVGRPITAASKPLEALEQLFV